MLQEVDKNLFEKKTDIYSFISCVYILLLVLTNIIGFKPAFFFHFVLPVGVFIYPLCHLTGALLSEIFGYPLARRTIWMGFILNLVTIAVLKIAVILPPEPHWSGQAAYSYIFNGSIRVFIASMIAFLVGELINVYSIAFLKNKFKGKYFGTRILLVTIFSEAIGTLLLITIAFYGTLPFKALLSMIISYYAFKIAYTTLMSPLLVFISKKI